MAQLTALWEQAVALFTTLFLQPDWRNILDIAIMAVIIYQVIRLAVRTRASSVFKGIALLLVLAWVAEVMQLNTLRWMLQLIINTGVIVLVVLFQPELRRALGRALEQIGRSRIRGNSLFVNKQVTEARHEISEIVTALTDLSRRRIGALIVVERGTGLKDVVESGTRIDAEITAPLIENIFEPNPPLHDGALIIRSWRRLVFAAFRKFFHQPRIGHAASRGAGHFGNDRCGGADRFGRNGIISTAREGKLTRHLDAKALTALLTDLFAPESAQTPAGDHFQAEGGRAK